MGRGTIESGLFRAERYEIEQRTSDPSNPDPDEEWLRVDIKPTYEDANGTTQTGVAEYRIANADGTVDTAPVAALGHATGTEVVDKRRAFVDAGGSPTGKGFVPYATSGATYGKRRMEHPVDGRVAMHDALTVSAIPDSVVNRWPINEGSGTTFADAVGTADGTWFGGTWVADSNFIGGYGYSLDGVDDYGDTGATCPAGSRTLAATVELPTLKSVHERLHGWQSGGDPGTCFLRSALEGDTDNLPSFTSISDSGNIYRVDATSSVATNTKTRIVGVLDDDLGELRMYINGSLNNTTAISGSFTTQLSNHKVGRRSDDTTEFLEGVVDEPLIDGTAWDGATAEDDYNRQPWS